MSLNDVYLHHDESTSRKATDAEVRKKQRSSNVESLKARFGYVLRRELRESLLLDDGSLSGKPLRIGIAVTTTDIFRGAGDLYTALGLGNALRRALNCEIRYLNKFEWYEGKDLDIYIAVSYTHLTLPTTPYV